MASQGLSSFNTSAEEFEAWIANVCRVHRFFTSPLSLIRSLSDTLVSDLRASAGAGCSSSLLVAPVFELRALCFPRTIRRDIKKGKPRALYKKAIFASGSDCHSTLVAEYPVKILAGVGINGLPRNLHLFPEGQNVPTLKILDVFNAGRTATGGGTIFRQDDIDFYVLGVSSY